MVKEDNKSEAQSEPEYDQSDVASVEEPRKRDTEASKSPVILDGRLVERAGLIVFVLSGAVGVLFLFFSIIFADNVEPWIRFRSVELFAMLAAIGIIVSLISRTRDKFISALGVLIIGALIIPTKDMVYFTLLITGRSLSEEVGGAALKDGSEFKGRDSDLANKIITNLQETSRQEGERVTSPSTAIIGDLDNKARTQAVLSISRTVANDRITTHLERLRYSGALGLLLSFRPSRNSEIDGEGGSFREFYYRYGEEEEFLEDLRTLRAQELVNYSYTDVAEAEVTFLGKQVICEYHRIFDSAECPFLEVLEFQDRVQARIPQIPRESIGNLSSPRSQALAECRDGFRNLQGELTGDVDVALPYYAPLKVASTEGIRVTIELTDLVREVFVDPYLVLLRVGLVNSCEIVEYDDDGGGGLNSRITVSLQKGDYVVAALNYGRSVEGFNSRLSIKMNSVER